MQNHEELMHYPDSIFLLLLTHQVSRFLHPNLWCDTSGLLYVLYYHALHGSWQNLVLR
jgi:hypothetical protein